MTTTQERPIEPQRFDARNLQQKSVTVFTDGAEVRRVFDVKLEKGRTDVIVDVSSERPHRNRGFTAL